ncbi:hypothetical protein BDV33DRAFT_163533 [Aspergillus novoparasiticus]|uniref:Uncharacterized protein n=1 Tax=Aspergillus novoparasiticus TaxID=986946 RepID=A0A5N6F734_9EURO|nr:hypothetical protein BDV33DRAFT_163533 [Aspergillus novoparasiticus]
MKLRALGSLARILVLGESKKRKIVTTPRALAMLRTVTGMTVTIPIFVGLKIVRCRCHYGVDSTSVSVAGRVKVVSQKSVSQ